MSEREELEAVIERAVDQALDIAGQAGGFPPFREKIATAIINSGYTQGNGELVEAVRECVAYFEVMNVTGSLPDQCRKALSDSEEAAPVACDVPVWGRLREFVAHPDTTDAHRKDLQRLLFDFMADAHDPGETPLHGDGVRDDTEAVQERVNAGLTIGDSHE